MKERLFKLLGIEPEEETMVSMLLAQSIFLGIFFGAFDISAHSLFLSVFDEKAMARAYVVSGLAGIILTSLYTWLQARIRFSFFATGNLVFVTAVTFGLWLMLLLVPGNFVTFAVFIMLGPLNILAMLGFWGTTGRLFSLRQGKRLFGLVDAGLIIGIIISCYSIPVILSLGFESHNILLASTAGVLVAVVIQALIGKNFTFVASGAASTEKRAGLSVFRNDSYIRVMGIFVALSVMTAFFVQYSFMAVTRLQYPQEEDMAKFLGLFTGSMMIFTLLIKLFLFSYLIRNYGLKTCLALSPVLIAGFTAFAILIGMTMGYTPESLSGFLIFFLVLALSRLFSKSLKDSIESPSFKVIYQTVDEKIRYEVQSGIDGTINEISALSSGLLLAGLGALSFISLIHFSWVLFIIIILWVVFAFMLYAEYRKSIRKSLGESDYSADTGSGFKGLENLNNRIAAESILNNNYFAIINGDLSSIDKSDNYWFLRRITELAETRHDPNLLPALKRISVRPDIEETLRYRAVEAAQQIGESGGDPRRLPGKTSYSAEDDRIIDARKMLADTRMPQTTTILRLLRDNNIEARRCAIHLIGKFMLSDMIPEVCNCIGIPGLETDSLNVLGNFGKEAHNEIFRRLLGSSGNIHTSKSLIRLLAASPSQENSEFLFSLLWSNSRRIKELAAEMLIRSGFRAELQERDKLHQLISETIGMITWNISAQVSLEKTDNRLLPEAVRTETNAWNRYLFDILSVAYERNSTEKIRTNIESGTAGSINYALEMIDIVIDASIKPRLVALVDVVPDEVKLKNLQHFYPAEIKKHDQLIEDILNRDYNMVSIWTKACSLRTLEKITDDNLRESVTALLFSPERLLQEEAARLVARTGRDMLDEVLPRIKGKTADNLKKILSGKTADEEFLFEKTRFLSSVFKDIPEDELLFLAGSLELSDKPNVPAGSWDNCLVWPASDKEPSSGPMVIFDGEEISSHKYPGSFTDSKFYKLPLRILEEFRIIYPERAFEIFSNIENTANTQ